MPYLRTVGTAVIANIAGEDEDQFVAMAEMLGTEPGLAAIELNISCPNVSHGLDLGIDASTVGRLVRRVRSACPLPIIAKLTPNVTDIVPIAAAAADGRRRCGQPDQHHQRNGRGLAAKPADPRL